MSFESKTKTLNQGRAVKYLIFREGERLRFSEYLNELESSRKFRSFFINLLAEVPFRAYQWETPPVQASNTEKLFEFTVTRNPGINLPPDPGPFSQYFKDREPIAVFNNLGNDAKLIAPAPFTSHDDLNYSHIGVFTEQAPMVQQHTLWQTVAEITKEHISEQRIWLNTAGGGVAWLHVRLDSRPKYYQHQPYTK